MKETIMVENAQALKEKDMLSGQLKEAEQKIRILYEISRFVSSFLHLQNVLDAIVDLLVKEFKLDACSIRQLDKEGNLKIMSHKGLTVAFVEKATRKPTVNSYSGDCFLTGKIIIVNDAEHIDKPISTNLIVNENIKAFALCPIKVEGETIGVLGTGSKKKDYFHERFNDMIYIIANQIGIAIRISKLYGELYSLSRDLENKVKERTEELEKRTKQLIAAERRAAYVEMSSIIAHELRNSLTIVGGFTRRLYERIIDDDPDKREFKIIIDEVRVLEEKVSKIINMGSDNEER
jgi:phosphoserine phosphatase RsbU/P